MGLTSTFRVQLNDFATEGYWDALSDVNDIDAEQAAKRALRDCEFMPAPSVLRKFVATSQASRFCDKCRSRPCECRLIASLPDKPDPRISDAIKADMAALHEHLTPKADA